MNAWEIENVVNKVMKHAQFFETDAGWVAWVDPSEAGVNEMLCVSDAYSENEETVAYIRITDARMALMNALRVQLSRIASEWSQLWPDSVDGILPDEYLPGEFAQSY